MDEIPDARIVPANEASWDDLQTVLGRADHARRCQCQRQAAPRTRTTTPCGRPCASSCGRGTGDGA